MSTACRARDNPFAMHHVERIPFKFDVGDWCLHLQRLRQLNYCGAIVGPEGAGKTTLLLELQEKLTREFSKERKIQFVLIEENSRIRRTQIQTLAKAANENPILLIDGSERANWLQRKQLFRLSSNGTGVIVAVHQVCQIPTWITCSVSQQLMVYTLEHLVGDASRRLRELADLRFQERDGNIRMALRDLYDDWSEESLQESV